MTTHSIPRALTRLSVVAGLAATTVVLTAGLASAHITTDPAQVDRAEYNQITFRVPNEEANATTVKLELTLPTDTPITSVRTAPMPGWKAEVATVQLDKPVTVDKTTIKEAVRTVTWTADAGGGIAPGQFGAFSILTGVLPEHVDTVVVPAVQTYSDGSVARWIQRQGQGADEPEFPAPIVNLTGSAAEDDHAGSTPAHNDEASSGAAASSDDTARWMAGIGIAVGALGLGVGVGTVLRSRRRPAAAPETTSSSES
jgi:uncharacterized protein YcnI